MAIDPQCAEAFRIRAISNANLLNFEGAITDYLLCLVLNPKQTSVYIEYGLLLQLLKKHEESIQVFKHLFVLEPNNIQVPLEIAKMYQILG